MTFPDKMCHNTAHNPYHFNGHGITITAVGFLGIRRGFMSQLILLCIGCVVVLQTTRQLLFFDLKRKPVDDDISVVITVTKNGSTKPTSRGHSIGTAEMSAATAARQTSDRSPPLTETRESDTHSPPNQPQNNVSSTTVSQLPVVLTWDGVETMKAIIGRAWQGDSYLCHHIHKTRGQANNALLPITINITFGCKELFEKAGCGTGNFIVVMYGMRLVTQVFPNVGLSITCTDAEQTKEELIMPWLTGWFPPRSPDTPSLFPMVKPKDVCGAMWAVPIARMYEEMRYDFRRMAVELIGIPERTHPSAMFVETARSLKVSDSSSTSSTIMPSESVLQISPVPSARVDSKKSVVEMDDAVVHFRCGDLMNSDHVAYGFITFHGYTRLISPQARSIGILTSPFEGGGQVRGLDSGPTIRDRCIIVVSSFVEYVQKRFPNARVRVHNDAKETIAITYSRMIMANQTIVGISSFGVFPAIGTFGTGYLRRPDYDIAPNRWVLHPPIDELADNVVLFDEPKRIMVASIKELWETRGKEGVLEWFWNDTAI
jgi:hypothetical protein